MANCIVTGAGGFIGHWLTCRLKDEGHWVRGVDLKQPEFEPSPANEFQIRDLRLVSEANSALYSSRHIDVVFNLAASMGGIGFISANHALIAGGNIRINLNMLDAATNAEVGRFIYSSSACVYSASKQRDTAVTALREEDASPADPEPGYGWEKLYAEKLCEYYRTDYGLQTQIVRFHNVGGKKGCWTGGREKAPAAACRKVAEAANGSSILVWGDGQATRSYMHVDDCVEGLMRLWQNGFPGPINLGTSELISVTDLHELAIEISGKKLTLEYDLTKPQGVRGRNSDNTLIKQVLGWEPATSIRDWLPATYEWIAEQVEMSRVATR